MIKNCVMCGRDFEAKTDQKLTCRPTCAKRHEALMRGDIVPCPICGQDFIPIKIRGEKQRTCSLSCGAKLKVAEGRGPQKGMGSLPPIVFTCVECGVEFVNAKRSKSRKYCSKSCVGRARGKRNKGWVPSPEWRAKASKRMTENNPMSKSDVLEKMKPYAESRADQLRKVRGGNGQLTRPQLLLHEHLDWPMEYPIPTGNPKWHTAVPDLANPDLKIAIECDGGSHYGAKKRERDRQKDKMLTDLGWIVLRFKNRLVLQQTESVLAAIHSAEKSRSSQ
jgi:hypothetical protein